MTDPGYLAVLLLLVVVIALYWEVADWRRPRK